MYAFLIVLIAIIAVLLAVVVLLQSGKGGGLAGIASGGATTQILGARQAPDVLEKATWTLATAFIVLCIATNFFVGAPTVQDSVIQERASDAPVETAPPTLPAPDAQPVPDGQ